MDKEKSKKFLEIADTIFAPIYPVIAGQIVKNTGIRSGTALDVGSGPGHLATALAKASDLKVYALDLSPDMFPVCEKRVIEMGLSGRVMPVQGNVSSIPFDDATFDLVVSRGSWFFWDDLEKALAEVYRVLKPGGRSYIGGGFGTIDLKKQIIAAMKERDPDFESSVKDRFIQRSPEVIKEALHGAGVEEYSFINDDSGFWLIMVRS